MHCDVILHHFVGQQWELAILRLRATLAANPYITLKLRASDDVIGTLCELFEKYLQISANNAGQNDTKGV